MPARLSFPVPSAPRARFRLGISTYTYRGVGLDTLVARCHEVDVRYIEMSNEEFEVPQITIKAIATLKEKLAAGGIEMLSWYCGHMSTAADLDRLVTLSKQMGVKQVSGSADRELLADLDAACSAADLRFGIHNHFFEDREFPYESPEDLLSAMAGRSPNLFVTLDTGHMIACGFDPTEAYLKLKAHVQIIHLKDEDRPGHNVVLGKGKGNMAKFLRTIVREGFDGLAAIEYEERIDPRQEVAECVQFVREQVRLLEKY